MGDSGTSSQAEACDSTTHRDPLNASTESIPHSACPHVHSCTSLTLRVVLDAKEVLAVPWSWRLTPACRSPVPRVRIAGSRAGCVCTTRVIECSAASKHADHSDLYYRVSSCSSLQETMAHCLQFNLNSERIWCIVCDCEVHVKRNRPAFRDEVLACLFLGSSRNC